MARPNTGDGGFDMSYIASTSSAGESPRRMRSTSGTGSLGGGGSNAWHDVLELCKKGFSAKMERLSEEIRAEIQGEVRQAAQTLRNEASDVTASRDRMLVEKLSKVVEKVNSLEIAISGLPGPANLDPIMQQIRRSEQLCVDGGAEVGHRVDRGVDELGKQVERSLGLAQRLEEQMSRLESQTQRAESKLAGGVEAVQQQLTGSTVSLAGEVQKVSQQDHRNHLELERACADLNLSFVQGLKQVSDQMNEKLRESESTMEVILKRMGSQLEHLTDKVQSAEQKLSGDVSNVCSLLNGTCTKIVQEVRNVQMQDDKHYTDFGFNLETQLASQSVHLQDVKQALEHFDFDPVHTGITKSRKQVNMDMRVIMGEIARVQQALHIDFVQMSDTAVAKTGTEGGAAKMKKLMHAKTGRTELARNVDIDHVDIDTDSIAAMSRTRVREFFTQTQPPPLKDTSAQTDPMAEALKDDGKKKIRKSRSSKRHRAEEDGPKKAAFAGADTLKEKAKAASMKPPYNVANFYHERGLCQKMARSGMFENITLFVVFVNAIWIGVDTDLNNAPVLVSADLPFVIAENTFCFYFTCELLIRFGAFEKKLNCFRDAWFVFDLCLVMLMIAETWVMTVVIIMLDLKFENGAGGMSMFRMFKLVKLLRLSRMARLLRAVPELVIIMKGLGFAARSVSIFFLLCTIIVYLFAVAFRQLTEGLTVGTLHFQSVPHAMDTLLLNGVFADSQKLISEMTSEEVLLWPIIVFFFALVSVTIMYMLVGVLVDVVGLVATVEKEGIEVSYIAGLLRNELQRLGYKAEAAISNYEFQKIMLEPSIMKIVAGAGVDVIVLADMMDLIMEDINSKGGTMTFPDLMDLVLSMRGSNPATVKDFKEQIRMFKVILNDSLNTAVGKIRQQLNEVQNQIQDQDSGSEYDDDDNKVQALGSDSDAHSADES